MKENKIIHAEGVNVVETDKDDFDFVVNNNLVLYNILGRE